MSARATTTPGIVLLCAIACTEPLPSIPQGARITCTTSDECPAGWTCKAQLGRCVPVGSDDVAPVLVPGSLTPSLAGTGARIEARFELDEELLGPPDVRLGSLPFTLEANDGRAWTFSYRVAGTEPEGTAIVLVTATDRFGNVARDLSLGTVLLDFASPAISEVVVVGNRTARRGGTLTVQVSVGEALPEAPVVELVGGRRFQLVASESTLHRFSHADDGSAPEGPASVRVVATDGAGNATERTLEGLVSFDFTAPAVVPESARFLANPVRAGAAAAVGFAVTEPLAGLPGIVMRSAGGAEVGWRSVSVLGLEVSASQVLEDVVDGEYQVFARALTDGAGNVGGELALGVLVVDSTAPQTVGLETSRRRLRSGDELVVTFEADEPLATEPTVTVGERAAVLDVREGLRFAHRFVADAALDAEGPADVVVDLRDLADNTRFAVRAIDFDFTAPAIASSQAAPAMVKLGDDLVYSLQVTEALDGDGLPVVSVFRDGLEQIGFFGAPVARTATGFTWTRAGGELADGAYAVVVSMTDVAGNPSGAVDAAGFAVDRTSPVVVGLAASRERIRNGDPFTIEFDVSEALAGAPVVTVAGRAAELEENSALHFRYRFVPDMTRDPEGIANVVVSVRDVAGNPGAAVATVELDFTRPAVALSQATPSTVKLGDDLVYSLQVNELLGGADGLPVLRIDLDGELQPGFFGVPTTRTATGFTWTKAGAELADGSYTGRMSLTDVAGNVFVLEAAGFLVDRTPPLVTNVVASHAHVRAGDPLRISFDASEPLGGPPLVTIAGRAAVLEEESPPHYVFGFVPEAAVDAEGMASVVVSVRDVAGNSGSAGTTVELDFTPPAIASSQAAPALVKLGDDLAYSLQVTEPLGGDGLPVLSVFRDGIEQSDLFGAPAVRTATGFTWRKSGAALADGSYAARVVLTDPAGNVSAPLEAVGFAVDRSPPVVGDVVTSRSHSRDGDPLDIMFDVSESLDVPPVVTVDGRAAGLVEQSGLGYAFRFVPDASVDDEGLANVVVTAHDPAGNSGSAVTTVELDFTAPSLVAASASPRRAGLGAELVVSMTPSEPLLEFPAVRAPRALVLQPITGTTYAWRHAVTSVDVDAEYEVALTLTDLAGNTAEVTGPRFSVDARVPEISNLATDRTRYSARPAFDAVTATFDASESLDEAPATLTVTLGGLPMTCGAWSGTSPSYTCRFTVRGDEAESAASVLVAARDAADNAASAGTSVTLDFTPPAISSAAVLYVAAAANPLGVVTAATAGTRVVVTVLAAEAIDTRIAPVLTLTLDGELLSAAATAVEHDVGSARFEIVVPAGAEDGEYVPAVAWRDVAGNTTALATFAAPPVRIKTSAPVLAVAQADVTYVRSPWGNAAPENLAGFTVQAGPNFALAPADPLSGATTLPAGTFAFASGAVARLRLWADGSRSSLVGIAAPGVDGAWPRQRLANLDTPTLWATGLDEAGNESAPVRIENAEWVATPNPPAFGTSPHALEATTFASATLRTDPITTTTAGQVGRGADGNAMLAEAKAAWRVWVPDDGDPSAARSDTAMAYDSGRGRVVLFGGSGETYLQDTWEWDGSSWVDRTPTGTQPSARSRHALAYDAARGRVVLFGGITSTGAQLRDTWEWDGVAWVDRTPSGAKPTARTSHKMAYDAARGRVVVFGGYAGSAYLQDTWEWDGSAWVDRTPAGTKPSPRRDHALAYDAARRQLVLFGGYDGVSAFRDTWTWDGNSWVLGIPSGAVPTSRARHAMAYDAARARILLFGGAGVAGGVLADTWEWDGSGWTDVTPQGASPTARVGHAMAYDTKRRRVVLVGGASVASSFSENAWEWDGAAWLKRMRSTSMPGARYSHALAYDAARDSVVLFGGNGISFGGNGAPSSDTWEWNGSRGWTWPTASTNPGVRFDHAMAYDSVRRRVVLFGGFADGYLGDTWEWDGTVWVDRTPAGTNPAARSGHALTYDVARGRVVLFGGLDGSTSFQDMWEWDGDAWVDRTPAGAKPTGRFSHAMAYDAARARVVLFGGRDPGFRYQDTWEWDGSGWAQRSPAAPNPSARHGHAMVYDAARERVVLVGGVSGELVQDTWEWDGRTWIDRTPPGAKPSARHEHAMAYDTTRRRLVLVGGYASGRLRDLWEWDHPRSQQPAFQFTSSALAAAIAPSALQQIRVRAHCGGVFSPFAAADTGATLHGWATSGAAAPVGGWVPLVSNATGLLAAVPWLAAPPAALLDWTSASAADARRFFLERDRLLAFQCRPTGDSGAGEARVAMDYIEVRVRYRTQE